MTEAQLKRHAGMLIDWLENHDLLLEDAIAVTGIAMGGLALAMAKAQDEPVNAIMEEIIGCMRASVGATRQ